MAQPTRTPVGFETIYQFAASYGSGVGYGSDLVSDGHGGFFGNTIEGGPAVCPILMAAERSTIWRNQRRPAIRGR